MSESFRTALLFLLAVPVLSWGQQAGNPAPRPNPTIPTVSPTVSAARIALDVVVTDKTGKPVTGLQARDFALLDDNKPQKLLSFQAFDGVAAKPDRPTEVILLFDYVNDTTQNIASERLEVQKYLQENGGHLAQPTSIFVLRDTGLQALRQPSTDGNVLADVVAKMETSQRVNDYASGANGDMERYEESLNAMSAISEYEKKPGRKLLFWIGPGWPLLNSLHYQQTDNTFKQYFKSIVKFSTSLREARIHVYSVAVGEYQVQTATGGEGVKWTNGQDGSTVVDDSLKARFVETSDYYNPLDYLGYLKGVKQFTQARAGDLSVKVLAAQNGGRVFGLDNGLKSQIDSCVQDAGAYYTLSFDPPRAARPNEYHDLKVLIENGGQKLTAHTSTGYYNQP